MTKQPNRLNNHQALSLLVAVILPAVIYTLGVPTPNFGLLVLAFVVIVSFVQLFSMRTLADLHDARLWAIARSVLCYTAWFLLFFLLPSSHLQIWYMFISVPILFLAERVVGYAGETILITHTILTSFGLLMAASGAEYYFHAGSTVLTLAVFIVLFVLTRATYVFVPQTSSIRLASSLVVALLATEIHTAVLFLPYHYTVLGFLTFAAFYVLWLCTYYWQFGVLTRQRVVFYVGLVLALIAILLLVTPWHIVS